jgi:hypothetical protein
MGIHISPNSHHRQFWDPRQPECLRSYSQHYDYISDFLYLDDKRQLITTR